MCEFLWVYILLQHEVICLSEKVVIRAEDLVSLLRTPEEVKWQIGLKGVYGPDHSLPPTLHSAPTLHPYNTSTNHNNNKVMVANSGEGSGEDVKPTVIKAEGEEGQTSPKIEGGINFEGVKSELSNNFGIKTEANINSSETVDAKDPAALFANELDTLYYPPPVSGALDIREIKREKKLIGE